MQDNKAIICIDLQVGFYQEVWGQRNNPSMEKAIEQVLGFGRNQRIPIIHVKHNSLHASSPLAPNQPGNEFIHALGPIGIEPVFEKTVNSAFMGTDLERFLRTEALNHLIFIGLTTDHCVSTSARMAANLGFQVSVLEDCTATFDRQFRKEHYFDAQLMHQTALASLSEEFATIIHSSQL